MSEEKSRKDDELPEEEYWQVHVPKPSVVVKKVGQLIERVRTPPRRCVHCGKTVSPDFKICPYCGASIEKPPLVTLKACAYCGAKLSPDFKVCPNCGKPVTETPQAQPSPPTPPLVHTPSILSPAATTPPPTPPAPSIQPSVRGEQQPQYWLDLGNSYYDNREYVKAGECYEKAYQISVTSVFAVPQALAYNAIKEREKRGLKLYRVRPGVVVSLLSVPEIERGTRGGEMLIIFFNGSQERSKIKVTPDIPKELEIDEAEFSVELWPGQYTLKSVRVKATDKAKLKEHTVSFNIESTGLKYRAGEAGVELASKAASMVIPFGGALISWLGAKGAGEHDDPWHPAEGG